jgi:hypothetical protein
MAASVRLALTVVMYVAVVSAARAQTVELPWKPDEATVKSMEEASSWPLDSYARYYKGVMVNGSRVIYGILLRGNLADEKPGIYLRDPPSFSMGRGCDQIPLSYPPQVGGDYDRIILSYNVDAPVTSPSPVLKLSHPINLLWEAVPVSPFFCAVLSGNSLTSPVSGSTSVWPEYQK